MYIMLKELNTPFRVTKRIYAMDLLIMAGFFVLGLILQGFVYHKIQFVFVIYNLLVGCFLTAPSFANAQKRSYQSILLMIRHSKNKRVYYPLPIEYASSDKMELRRQIHSELGND